MEWFCSPRKCHTLQVNQHECILQSKSRNVHCYISRFVFCIMLRPNLGVLRRNIKKKPQLPQIPKQPQTFVLKQTIFKSLFSKKKKLKVSYQLQGGPKSIQQTKCVLYSKETSLANQKLKIIKRQNTYLPKLTKTGENGITKSGSPPSLLTFFKEQKDTMIKRIMWLVEDRGRCWTAAILAHWS